MIAFFPGRVKRGRAAFLSGATRAGGLECAMYSPGPEIAWAFRSAARDYRWLLDRGYAESAALKLVGDRFQLPREERLVLFRGVAPSLAAASRRALLRGDAAGRTLLVDGHNQALAVMHYLAGRPVFVASDGYLRDAGGSHGRIPRPELFDRALGLLAASVASAWPSRVLAFFDSPIPKSAAHAAAFREALARLGVEVESGTENDADAPLKAAPAGGVVATSDSAVLDSLVSGGERPGTFDAARAAVDALRALSREAVAPWFDLGRELGDGAQNEVT